jgi:hypothetical protein
MKPLIIVILLLITTSSIAFGEHLLTQEQIKNVLAEQTLTPTDEQLKATLKDFEIAHNEWCAHRSTGNSKVSFSAVQIADLLSLNPKVDPSSVERIKRAITSLPCGTAHRCSVESGDTSMRCLPPGTTETDWDTYYRKTIDLTADARFISLVTSKNFSPVKISWEDIGRYEGSVWGDRISDVGVWVRKEETNPESAELALSVRRDSNFRDKVLVVPSERIKIHKSQRGKTTEVTLPERLRELGLSSTTHDKNVIVSNQFSIVPVPAARAGEKQPARAAFTFSIMPYGSTNYVITDVIEGSSEAIVGPGGHQLLYANVDGKKAPFTASRAAERKDLLELESQLKARGMDVDVQRYYLIQVPLNKNVDGVKLSNMGTPPELMRKKIMGGVGLLEMQALPESQADGYADNEKVQRSASNGLEKVAIGHGETEGPYNRGSGFEGKRAQEPIRVTVVYFVTPVGVVTETDMESFTKAFETWDSQALWGGSFVTKEIGE